MKVITQTVAIYVPDDDDIAKVAYTKMEQVHEDLERYLGDGDTVNCTLVLGEVSTHDVPEGWKPVGS